MSKPNFFIVGAARSGTTSLYHYLSQHPEIFMCPIKEPNYFCTDITKLSLNDPLVPKRGFNIKSYISGSMENYYHRAFVTEWDDYIALFKNVKNENAIGEASVNYLLSNVASKNIKNKIPEAKIIIILRNPIEQIVSHYLARVKLGQTNRSFRREYLSSENIINNKPDDMTSLLAQGLYFNQVKRFINKFPKENVKIIIYDDYKKDIKNTLINILTFLKVNSIIALKTKKAYNVSSGIRFQKFIYFLSFMRIKQKLLYIFPYTFRPKVKSFFAKPNDFSLNSNDRSYLVNFFKDDIENTAELINKDLNHWIV